MQENVALTGENELDAPDLGPLAWVLDELRKSLDGATKAMRRFVRDAALARGSDLAALDASQLRIARQQLHQAVGALEMVGMAAPARMLRAMEALAQRFVQSPDMCSDDAASKVERASFALTEYLEGVLKGKHASSVALFPQYRDVLQLVGDDRVHPADLWSYEWRWIDIEMPYETPSLAYDAVAGSRIDSFVLNVVKTGNVSTSRSMRDVALGFAENQTTLERRIFWKIAAAYFEAVSRGLCPPDVYAKRAASRILLQYRGLARGTQDLSVRLVQDLLFFCAQAVPRQANDAPVLVAVRAAYGLTRSQPFDYDTPKFGRFDPALLAQARKRIAAATETWSALAGGDTNRLKTAVDQFALVADSVTKLHPESGDLARALTQAVASTALSGEAPPPALAMEVATAVLYLEAAYEDMDPTDSNMAQRSASLAERLVNVNAGAPSEPLEAWMEELYRRVSDRQIMGSVVDELRTSLAEVETSLDSFFRDPSNKTPLHEVPSQLSQMRGVFSVLGLDQAALASLRMRSSVEKFLGAETGAESDRDGVFEKLGNSLGALGFLIDMLSYQREMAKKLFVYDDDVGEFKPLMGREKAPVEPIVQDDFSRETVTWDPVHGFAQPVAEPQPAQAPALPVEVALAQTTPVPESLAESAAPVTALAVESITLDEEDDEIDLKDIFLDEARDVAQTGLNSIRALIENPNDLAEQTTLRRAFHTLKGSSRMVGLNQFGEAAWSMEQLLNSWLAEQTPASDELIQLAQTAMRGFGRWVEDIAAGDDSLWSAQPFRTVADAMRLEGRVVDLVLPGDELSAGAPETSARPDFVATEMVDLDALLDSQEHEEEDASERVPVLAESIATPEFESLELDDFDFGDLPEVLESPTELVPDSLEALVPAPGLTEEVSAISGAPLEEVGSAPVSESVPEEQVKVIGPLRIDIPLYNVFLNEADEWSRRLLTELSEWALELHEPLPDTALALAHSLAGSSATVGFRALSDIARVLEQALQHVQLHLQGVPEHAQVFIESAEDIRRLLHQFAAGFLKDPNPALIEALRTILEIEFPSAPAMAEYAPQGEGTPEMPGAEYEPDLALPEPFAEAPELERPAEVEALPDLELATEAETPLAVTDAGAVDEAAAAASADELAELDELDESPEMALAAEAVEAHAADALPVAAESVTALVSAPPFSLFAVDALIDDDVDDIDALDQLDVDLFPIFEEEALELLPQLAGALRQWTAHPGNLAARNDALRVLHTLKGSARLAGAMHLGELAHRMESAIEHMGADSLAHGHIEPLLARFDAIHANFDELRSTPEQELSHPEAWSAIDEQVLPERLPEAENDEIEEVNAPAVGELAPTALAVNTVSAATLQLAPTRKASNQTVRVRAQLLDRLVNQAGEVMISRSRLEVRLDQLRASLGDLTGNLNRLRGQLRDIELQSESQMQSRLAQAKDSAQGFDPLEFDRFTRVQELTRMMAESVDDVATVHRNMQRSVEGTEDDLIAQGRQARELQRDLLRTRMVEFDGIAERLYGVVRQAAKETGKQVKLDIKGALDMDRGVLDRMAPAFEHMLRNSVVHGIETAEARLEAGKPAAGTITVELHQQSNDVTVEFGDDGAGLDLARIRSKARELGQFPELDSLSDADTADLIFTPGFSTASQVTELAGRGIGLDVVRAEVNALGGRIETATEPGKGTRFKLVLPLTTAVTQVVMLRLGEQVIGVPANLIEMVRRVPAAALDQAYQDDVFEFGGEPLPFFWSGALLQASAGSNEVRTKTLPVVIFRSAGQRVAMHVDEVLGNQEVVVKHLGPQLSRLPGLTGMSVLASGVVVLIYNPVALASVYGEQARELRRQGEAAASESASAGGAVSASALGSPSQVPLVLVVDDSITVRRVTQRLLKREGFRVVLAADGLQALERLQEETPAVVLSDIEMPRMDGFDLVRNIRGDSRLHHLPVIMITSRIAEKHRELARELGVDHYLGKPYSEDELIDLVRQHCTPAVALQDESQALPL